MTSILHHGTGRVTLSFMAHVGYADQPTRTTPMRVQLSRLGWDSRVSVWGAGSGGFLSFAFNCPHWTRTGNTFRMGTSTPIIIESRETANRVEEFLAKERRFFFTPHNRLARVVAEDGSVCRLDFFAKNKFYRDAVISVEEHSNGRASVGIHARVGRFGSTERVLVYAKVLNRRTYVSLRTWADKFRVPPFLKPTAEACWSTPRRSGRKQLINLGPGCGLPKPWSPKEKVTR